MNDASQEQEIKKDHLSFDNQFKDFIIGIAAGYFVGKMGGESFQNVSNLELVTVSAISSSIVNPIYGVISRINKRSFLESLSYVPSSTAGLYSGMVLSKLI